MNFEVSKPPNSLITLSSIDYPIFELASCNKPPAKYPPQTHAIIPLLPHPPPNKFEQITFCFFLKMNVINQSKIHY